VLLLIFSFFCFALTADEYEGGDKIAEFFSSIFTIWFAFPLFTTLELFDLSFSSKYDDLIIVIVFLNIILNLLLSFWLLNNIIRLFKSLAKKGI